jgi:hypothetical protein
MLASITHKFVLLSNPKCGTTALEQAYVRHCEVRLYGAQKWKHLTYRGLTDMFGDYFQRQGCDIFVTIRHPLDTLKSWYRYRSRDAVEGKKTAMSTAGISFDQFFAEWSLDKPPPRSRATSQREFLRDADGRIPPLQIYDYADLPRLAAELNRRLGRDVPLGEANVSPRMAIDWDEGALARSDKYARELEFYERARARAVAAPVREA